MPDLEDIYNAIQVEHFFYNRRTLKGHLSMLEYKMSWSITEWRAICQKLI